MNQLINDLITVPTYLSVILILSFIALFVLAIVADVYKDKHPYQKNPFIVYAVLAFITCLTIAIGAKVRISFVSNKPLDYVIVQKNDTDITIASKTMFVNDITLKIKENGHALLL
jgi:hypothetical protein